MLHTENLLQIGKGADTRKWCCNADQMRRAQEPGENSILLRKHRRKKQMQIGQ